MWQISVKLSYEGCILLSYKVKVSSQHCNAADYADCRNNWGHGAIVVALLTPAGRSARRQHYLCPCPHSPLDHVLHGISQLILHLRGVCPDL
eukprot:768650-Hanusia_phi.AAC.2